MYSAVTFLAIASVVNFALLGYALFFLPANNTNRVFCLFIFLLGIEQMAEAMMHGSSSVEVAERWQHFVLAPWIFIAPIGVLFILQLTRPNLASRPWLFSAILMPAMIFQCMLAARLDHNVFTKDAFWGWIANPTPDGPTTAIYLYISATALLMPLLLWSSYFHHRKSEGRRNQFLLLAIGVSVPYVGGVICEVIMPIAFGMTDIPLAGPLMTTFTVCALVAIRKYHMFDYSPRHQFSAILESMREGVMIVNKDGKIMYANNSLKSILRCKDETLEGKDADEITIEPLNFSEFYAERHEVKMRCGDLEEIWVELRTSPCLDFKKREIGMTCVVTDVDQLKKSNAKISRNELIMNRAQEVAHVGSWELSFATGKSIWSDEACRIYGFDTSKSSPGYEDWISRIHPADLASVMLQIKNSHETQSDSDFEFRIVLPDGTLKYLHSISKYEYDESGRAISLFGICKDITDIKLAERNLRATSRELETYIYKSSHDMHAPLASILGLINVSRLEIADPLAVRYLGMIEQQAKKLDSVRVEFIKAMQIKDEKCMKEEIHLNRMIGDILRDLRIEEGFARMNINVNVSPDKKLIANEFLMRTILQNLIQNSIRYQDQTRERSQLLIDFEQNEATSKITIEDNGIGIDPSIQDKIFDMYFKSEESRTGSGLGLYLVKKAVEKLNAQMSMNSSPGRGTRFTLSFAKAS